MKIMKITIIVLSLVSLHYASVVCKDLADYQTEFGTQDADVLMKKVYKIIQDENYNACISQGGEGAAFWASSPRKVESCRGESTSKIGYINVSLTCDYCTGEKVINDLDKIENFCASQCRMSNLICIKSQDLWGGHLDFKERNGEYCGEKFPECQDEESSDSQGDESSSSAFSSSSLPESSDSNEESSSSEDGDCDEDDPDACSSASEESSSSESLCPCTDEDGPCFDDDGICSENMSSSSSEKSSSSSMNGRYNLVYGYDRFCNNKGHLSSISGFSYRSYGTGAHYMRKPGFFGPKKFEFWCGDNTMGIYTNIPQVFSNLNLHIECYNPETKEWKYLNVPDIPVMYTCPDVGKSSIEGCPAAESVSSPERVITLDGNLHTIYYLTLDANLYDIYYASSISDARLETTGDDYHLKEIDDVFGYNYDSSYYDRFPSNYSRTDLLNEPEFVSFFNECKRRTKKIVDVMSMIKENGDDERQGENPWDVYSPYASWWHLSDEYYPSQGLSSFKDYCRSVRGENAVVYQADSLIFEEYYDEETSLIRKEYVNFYYCAPPKSSSSSAEVSSSSESSSSSEKSSSSEESSSSEPPSSSSLSSSSEESSSSSEEIVVESSSVMLVDEPFVAGPGQVYTPDQIFSSGLQNMEPGACYSLNPDRGTQHGWINNNAQDSWWWREVDCTTGEKVDRNRVGQCPGFPLDRVPSNPTSTCFAYNGKCYRCKTENSYVDCSQEWLWKWSFNGDLVGTWYTEVNCNRPLMRRELDDVNYGILVNESFDVNFTSSQKYFDIQGRNNAKRSSSERVLYRH